MVDTTVYILYFFAPVVAFGMFFLIRITAAFLGK